MTRETSVVAHDEVETDGTAATIRKRIAAALLGQPMTARALAGVLGEDLQSVTPRLAELKRMNLAVVVGEALNAETMKRAVQWGPTEWTAAFVAGTFEPLLVAPKRIPRALQERVLAASVALRQKPHDLMVRAEWQDAVDALLAEGYEPG